ncbi:MAG TPA: metal-dependent transcriptional regulator [bacterium]|jgi:DtxR family Mn-dependent transcriptional regulator|nr:metal-dependent transcriptional regulator [bacterium]
MATFSQAIQDYLKVIYKIGRRGRAVTTTALAQRMGVSAASATNMVKRLTRLGLVRHTPYRAAVLTPEGERAALEIIRHHRLLELFLHEHLGLGLDQVHDEAEELEHVLSEPVESRIAAMLGHPTADPHGDPIPSHGGAVTEIAHPRLGDLAPGAGGQVVRVSDENPRRLRRLATLGLVPGARVRVLRRGAAGTLAAVAGGRPRRVSAQLARAVFVAPRG